MVKLKTGIVELYRKVATSLPPDVESAIEAALAAEPQGSPLGAVLARHLQEVRSARMKKSPVCLESGVPVFYVKVPRGLDHAEIRRTIVDATREAVAKVPLGENAVDALTGVNTGDGTGLDFPEMRIEQAEDATLVIELMLKCAGPENESRLYQLPDASIGDGGAGRDLDGVAACVRDAVGRAGGRACPPYVIGVGVGASRDQVTALAKRQLLRKLGQKNPVDELARLEDRLLQELNSGQGRVLALGVKVGVAHRHPDSYFVDVSLSCWAHRRGKLIW